MGFQEWLSLECFQRWKDSSLTHNTAGSRVCDIGDVVEFRLEVSATTPPEGDTPERIEVGARYVVTGKTGAGWDFSRISGQGPTQIRILESDVPKYVRVITGPDLPDS